MASLVRLPRGRLGTWFRADCMLRMGRGMAVSCTAAKADGSGSNMLDAG